MPPYLRRYTGPSWHLHKQSPSSPHLRFGGSGSMHVSLEYSSDTTSYLHAWWCQLESRKLKLVKHLAPPSININQIIISNRFVQGKQTQTHCKPLYKKRTFCFSSSVHALLLFPPSNANQRTNRLPVEPPFLGCGTPNGAARGTWHGKLQS